MARPRHSLRDRLRLARARKRLADLRCAAMAQEIDRLRTVIRRALHELDPPAFYGEGSVWNDMIEATEP